MFTLNDIRKAMISKLEELFPIIPVHGEGTEHEATPYMEAHLLSATQTREVGNRYRRSHTVRIRYVPSSQQNVNNEMHQIAEELYSSVEHLTVNNMLLRGSGLRHEIIEGVMEFYANYECHIVSAKPEVQKMKNIKEEGYLHE